MTPEDVARIVAEFRRSYPPLINLTQASEISRLPKATVYDYSSRGLFDDFRAKVGRYVLLDLAGFVKFLLSHTPNDR